VRTPGGGGGAAVSDQPARLTLVLREVDEVEPGGEGARDDPCVLRRQLAQQRAELGRVPAAAVRDGQRPDALDEREAFGSVDARDRSAEQVAEEADLADVPGSASRPLRSAAVRATRCRS
jgi:hypothetical protein